MKISTALVLVLAAMAGGSGPVAAQTFDPDAVVKAVERHYNRVPALQARFVQRYTLGDTTLVESGRVYFLKPGKMRWEYNSPEEKLFVSDGKYAYFYVPSERQVRRSKLKKDAHWQSTFALLLGRANLKKVFKEISVVPVNRPEGMTRWQMRGTARSGKQGFHEIWFDLSESYQILRVEIRQRDGSLMEFHFRGWRETSSLNSGLFRLDVPSGTVWINEDRP